MGASSADEAVRDGRDQLAAAADVEVLAPELAVSFFAGVDEELDSLVPEPEPEDPESFDPELPDPEPPDPEPPVEPERSAARLSVR
ncbi:MAG: hypothetical protein RIA38_01165 [Microcella pacifica]